jgi:hypothetical protein
MILRQYVGEMIAIFFTDLLLVLEPSTSLLYSSGGRLFATLEEGDFSVVILSIVYICRSMRLPIWRHLILS